MTIDRRAATPAALAFAASLLTPAAAQTAQDTPPPPRGLESLAPQTVPVPAAPVIVLPTPTPTPTPSATPAARATPRPRPTRAVPEPTPAATATPIPAPAPSPTPTPVATATPAAAATPAPVPTPQPEPTLAAPDTGRTMPIWILPAVIVLVVAGLWALSRRRRDVFEPAREPQPVEQVPVEPEPIASPAVVAASIVVAPAAPQFLERPAPAAPRARLTVEMRPLRAGLNLLSAVADCELVVTNTGDAAAHAIRTQVTLLTAHGALDADLAALTAAPIGRPTTPPFSLAPGETRTIKAIAATPRDAIQTMTAANRPMFVPIVAVNLLYPDGQTTRAWAIGIERVDSAKLAPFWLDAPPKMYSDIGARPHAAAFER